MVRERFNILTLLGLSALFVCFLGSNFDAFVINQWLSQTSQKSKISSQPSLRHNASSIQIKSLNMRRRRMWVWARLVWAYLAGPRVQGVVLICSLYEHEYSAFGELQENFVVWYSMYLLTGSLCQDIDLWKN